jgi:zinc protease
MILDRTIAPKISNATEFQFHLPPISTRTLSNGIPVYWLNNGVQDVAEIDWVFPAGKWYEPKNGVALSLAALLKSGTGQQTAEQINEAIEFYGAQLKVMAGTDNLIISLYTLTRHLPVLLPVVQEIITDSVFPEKELEIFKTNSIQKLQVNLRKVDFIANRLIDSVLFGKTHPYGRYMEKTDYESITRSDIQAFFENCIADGGMKIFMAGKIGEQQLTILDNIFGGIPAKTKNFALPPHDIIAATEKQSNVDSCTQAVQGAIRIGRLFPNRTHPDYAPMVVLNTVFGGYFGSRLMSNIREEKGFTYGIHSSIIPELHGGSLVIQTETGIEVLKAAVHEIYREMAILKEELITDEELLLVKNYLLGGMLGDLDSPFSVLRRWRTLVLNGFDAEHFNNNVSIYKSVTAEELLCLAQKYFNKDEFYQITVV